jgi:hypothetical protein
MEVSDKKLGKFRLQDFLTRKHSGKFIVYRLINFYYAKCGRGILPNF